MTLDNVAKRPRTIDYDLSSKKDLTYTNYEQDDCPYKNTVQFSSDLFASLNCPEYVKIGRYVLKAIRKVNLNENSFRVSTFFKEEIIDSQPNAQGVKIVPFLQDSTCIPLKKIRFKVFPYREFDYLRRPIDESIVLADTLNGLIPTELGNQIVRTGQQFLINHPIVGPLRLKVSKCWFNGDEYYDLLDTDNYPQYGILTNETSCTFKTGNKNKILIVELIDKTIERLFFTIINVKPTVRKGLQFSSLKNTWDVWKSGLTPLPIYLKNSEIEQVVHEAWENKIIHPGKTLKIRKGDWQFTVRLSHFETEEDSVGDTSNWKAFYLQDHHEISTESSNKVMITNDRVQKTTAMTFSIEAWELRIEKEPNQVFWLNAYELIHQIRDEVQDIPLNGTISIDHGHFKLLLKLINVQCSKNIKRTNNFFPLWRLGNMTKVVLDAGVHFSSISLVNSSLPHSLKSVKFTVTRANKPNEEKTIIHEWDILNALRHAFPSNGVINSRMPLKGTTLSGIELIFKIIHTATEQNVLPIAPYEELYRVTSETDLSVSGEKSGNVIIDKVVEPTNIEDIHNKLVEAGLGGLPLELEKVILEIMLSRSQYKRYIDRLGIGPTRGILLCGPPGTGKTETARNLGKILGISDERVQLFTGAEVWDKWVGNSEKKVREMFKLARKDQDSYGDKSPLHLLILDEIDAFLQDRKTAKNRWETSVITTFLAELDGITSQGSQPLNNMIVIGMTNNPDKIDEAVKREGRLGTHIFMGLPTTEGRKEIFKIHTKKISENGKLADDVNFDLLSEITAGKTGAFISGVIKKAAKYHITRLHAEKVPEQEIDAHPDAKVTMEDLQNAIKECIQTIKPKVVKEDFIPSTKLTLEAISSDLAKLGLIALPKEPLDFLYDLKLASYYKKDRLTTGQELSRGILLYGESGTGKSSIARSIEKLLGLDSNRFQYFCASQLWPKHGKDLHESISSVIGPAKNAARDLGKEAPLHVIVIDELDWIYRSNQISEKEAGSLMGHLIREVQNLFVVDELKPSNLVVVGIASGKFLDGLKELTINTPAKLIEVTLPTAVERKAILSHYLDVFIQQNRLSEGTLQKLIEKSVGRSGNFIEKWVKEAVTLMYRNAGINGVSPEDISQSILNYSFFDLSYKTLIGDEIYRNNYI